MTDKEQKRIIGKNINRLIKMSGKQQQEIADALDIPPTTFNTWCMGRVMPRYSKLQKLAEYFGCSVSEIVDDQDETAVTFDPTATLKQSINKSLSIMSYDQLKKVAEYVEMVKLFDQKPIQGFDTITKLTGATKLGHSVLDKLNDQSKIEVKTFRPKSPHQKTVALVKKINKRDDKK